MSIKSLVLYIDNLSSISILTGTFKLNKLIKALCMVLIFGDDRGADNYSIPPRIDFDPFSKLDTSQCDEQENQAQVDHKQEEATVVTAPMWMLTRW